MMESWQREQTQKLPFCIPWWNPDNWNRHRNYHSVFHDGILTIGTDTETTILYSMMESWQLEQTQKLPFCIPWWISDNWNRHRNYPSVFHDGILTIGTDTETTILYSMMESWQLEQTQKLPICIPWWNPDNWNRHRNYHSVFHDGILTTGTDTETSILYSTMESWQLEQTQKLAICIPWWNPDNWNRHRNYPSVFHDGMLTTGTDTETTLLCSMMESWQLE